jgi:phosphopentomutase
MYWVCVYLGVVVCMYVCIVSMYVFEDSKYEIARSDDSRPKHIMYEFIKIKLKSCSNMHYIIIYILS